MIEYYSMMDIITDILSSLKSSKEIAHEDILLRYNGITTWSKSFGYQTFNKFFLIDRYMIYYNPKFKIGEMF